MLVGQADIPDAGNFSVSEIDGWTVYLDKALAGQAGKLVIDIAGWSTFKRLIITEN
jgi:hypothetical protein